MIVTHVARLQTGIRERAPGSTAAAKVAEVEVRAAVKDASKGLTAGAATKRCVARTRPEGSEARAQQEKPHPGRHLLLELQPPTVFLYHMLLLTSWRIIAVGSLPMSHARASSKYWRHCYSFSLLTSCATTNWSATSPRLTY